MRALFTSKNLIGDGLCICPALTVWHREHPDWEMDLLTQDDHATVIYRRMGLPLNVITSEDALRRPYDFEFKFEAGIANERVCHPKKVHMVQGYAELLGVHVEREPMIFEVEEEEHERDLILLSVFSRSCASMGNPPGPPNKMIPWFHWPPILTLLRTYGKIAMLGAPDDRAPLPIGEEEYQTGIPLNRVALMMRDCRFLVTLDNGMAHLAATQNTPMVEFYPACLGLHFMVPWGNDKRKFMLHIDPAVAAPAQTVYGLRQGIDFLASQGLIHNHLFDRK